MEGILPAWGRILSGYRPNLSIEITRECPLRCPGCYAYGADHLGGGTTLRELADLKGQALVDGVLRVVERHRPIHVSLIGGEPLVRHRELTTLLPLLSAQGIYTQVVTSAVRPIPLEWTGIPRLHVSVSVDGLQPEHDARRTPATYDRILKHIQGHAVTVHCTITRPQSLRAGYFEAFVEQWSAEPHVRQIWFSLYTPQRGEESAERLLPEDRARVIAELAAIAPRYPKLRLPQALLKVYAEPPASPADCIFARTTTCLSADLRTTIDPCQFGGNPDCSQCGCMASAGLGAVGRHELPGGLQVARLFEASERVGQTVRAARERLADAALW
jgi:MoaA/NifB/PqqE/SkfB family radical SAM enzyme